MLYDTKLAKNILCNYKNTYVNKSRFLQTSFPKTTEFNLWSASPSLKGTFSVEMLVETNAGNNWGKHSATSSVDSWFIKNSHKISKIFLQSFLPSSYNRIIFMNPKIFSETFSNPDEQWKLIYIKIWYAQAITK